MIKNLKELMEKNPEFEITFCLKSGKEYKIYHTTKDNIQIMGDIIKIAEDSVTWCIFDINQIESIRFSKS